MLNGGFTIQQEIKNQEIIVELLSHQYDFICAKTKFHALISGVSAGKTAAGAIWIIYKMLTNPETLGLVAANTYPQLRNVVIQELTKWLERWEIRYSINWNTKRLKILDNNSQILCTSMENFNSLRGVEIGYFWLDEARDTTDEAFRVLIGRLRHPASKKLEGRITTTPNGFDWIYDRFAGTLATKDYSYNLGRSRDNIHVDPHYFDSLALSYDQRFAKQELEGLFISMNDQSVYYAFDRAKNVIDMPIVGTPWFACDFNCSPITAVRGYASDNQLYITDEIFIKNSNTFQLADTIIERWGKGNIVPDATGKARRTSSLTTDHQILRDKGLNVITQSINPAVKDRYNCANGHLSHRRLLIHPRCINLINDFERLQPNNKDPNLSHISDSCTYLVWHLFPLQPSQQRSRTITL